MKKRYYILPFLMVLSLGIRAQQNPHFSTYMFNPFSLNPAFVGSKQVLYLNTVQRYQWIALSGAPRSQSLNVQIPTKRHRVGYGFNFQNDQVGANQNFSLLGAYAYHLRLPVGRLSLGLRGGVQSVNIDFRKVEYEDKTDPYNNVVVRRYVPTGDFGVYYYTRDSYVSLALNQLWGAKLTSFKEVANYSRLYPHLFFIAGKAFPVGENLILNPSVMVKGVKGSPTNFDLNFNLRFANKIWVGASYRHKVALVLLTQFNITDKLRFGYSYDFGVNKIGTASGSTHEFYLGYDFNIFNTKVVSTRYL